jgi:hypothetical protein
MKRRSRPKRRNFAFRAVLLLLLALAVGVFGWCRWVYVQIESYAGQDQAAQAAPADAIGVFGAAGPPRSTAPALTTLSRSTTAASLRSSSPWEAAAATSTTRAPWAAST